jgi:putative ABC transport system ATP-binding protein
MDTEQPQLLSIRDLSLTRASGPGFTLSMPRLDIEAGDKVAITGSSGCGKSTALDLLGMVLRPDAAERFRFAPRGQAVEDVAACWQAGQRDRLAGLRQRHMGYVLQTGGLLPFLNVFENMELSARALDLPGRREHVTEIAKALGVERLLGCKPDRLSIGERQRVAIGRALASRPAVILADEPTASLDPAHAEVVMGLLLEAVAAYAVTLILVTHSPDIVRRGGLAEYRIGVAMRQDGGVSAVLEA